MRFFLPSSASSPFTLESHSLLIIILCSWLSLSVHFLENPTDIQVKQQNWEDQRSSTCFCRSFRYIFLSLRWPGREEAKGKLSPAFSNFLPIIPFQSLPSAETNLLRGGGWGGGWCHWYKSSFQKMDKGGHCIWRDKQAVGPHWAKTLAHEAEYIKITLAVVTDKPPIPVT